MSRDVDLLLGLDRDEPSGRRQTDGDTSRGALHFAAVSIAHPTQLGKEDAAVVLLYAKLQGIGVSETLVAAFLFEPRERGPAPRRS